jgi:GTP-binding protein
MSNNHKIPQVAIVGRMNVGKSTLFNRLAVNTKSMTYDYEGVTRDFVYDTISWGDKTFQIVDTGGISLKKTSDPLLEQSRAKVLDLIREADVCLFVCDGTVGLVPEDRDIAKQLRRAGKAVIVVVNKIDVAIAQEQLHEFERLGYKTVIPISAQHARGMNDLYEAITELLPESATDVVLDDQPLKCRVVLIGKPNVGKSSLINILTKQERSLVSDIPGTTREAISEKISFYHEDILVTDTPGIRKKGSVSEPLESMMVKTSFRAVDAAHIVLLLVDATEGQMSDQELKLAFYAFEDCKKALIILFNKQDLTNEEEKEALEYDLDKYQHLMKKVERLTISCKTGKNIGKVLPLISSVWEKYSFRFPEEELSLLFKDALRRRPFYKSEQLLMIHTVRQTYVSPITITLRVNMPQWFGESQLGYFENVLRTKYDLKGVPIKFVVIKKRDED